MRAAADWLPKPLYAWKRKARRGRVARTSCPFSPTLDPAPTLLHSTTLTLYARIVHWVSMRYVVTKHDTLVDRATTLCPSSQDTNNTTSSPLRSNMSSANRGAGPSNRGNKRARDDEDVPSSAAHPPSSRRCNDHKRNNKQLIMFSYGLFPAYASARRRCGYARRR
jgi:hypothetical protein